MYYRDDMAAVIAAQLGVPPTTIFVSEIGQPGDGCTTVRVYFSGMCTVPSTLPITSNRSQKLALIVMHLIEYLSFIKILSTEDQLFKFDQMAVL